MTDVQKTTYADLRDGDILIDKSGGRWHVSGISVLRDPAESPVDFWLGDARTEVRLHHMTKPAGDSVTVERIATHADDVQRLRSEVNANLGIEDPWQTPETEPATHEAAVAGVEEQLGGRVEAESSAAEIDAAKQATEDDPVVLPLFESMTDLEQRSHLFVMHGLFVDDLDDRKSRADVHAKAHEQRAQGKLKGRHTPHVHTDKASA